MAISVRLSDVSVGWFDRRRLLGIVLAAVAAFLVLSLTRPAPTVPILVASADIQPGRPLSPDDISVRYVQSSTGLVEGTSLGELVDWSLRVPVFAGEPIIPSLLQPPELQVAPNVVALSLAPSHAVLGQLAAGDRVDIYRTMDGSPSAPGSTELLASDVYVVEATLQVDGIGAGTVDLLLAVDDSLAGEIVAAERLGSIDLVRIAP